MTSTWRVKATVTGVPAPTPEEYELFEQYVQGGITHSYNNRTRELTLTFTLLHSDADVLDVITKASGRMRTGLRAFRTFKAVTDFHLTRLSTKE